MPTDMGISTQILWACLFEWNWIHENLWSNGLKQRNIIEVRGKGYYVEMCWARCKHALFAYRSFIMCCIALSMRLSGWVTDVTRIHVIIHDFANSFFDFRYYLNILWKQEIYLSWECTFFIRISTGR